MSVVYFRSIKKKRLALGKNLKHANKRLRDNNGHTVNISLKPKSHAFVVKTFKAYPLLKAIVNHCVKMLISFFVFNLLQVLGTFKNGKIKIFSFQNK